MRQDKTRTFWIRRIHSVLLRIITVKKNDAVNHLNLQDWMKLVYISQWKNFQSKQEKKPTDSFVFQTDFSRVHLIQHKWKINIFYSNLLAKTNGFILQIKNCKVHNRNYDRHIHSNVIIIYKMHVKQYFNKNSSHLNNFTSTTVLRNRPERNKKAWNAFNLMPNGEQRVNYLITLIRVL